MFHSLKLISILFVFQGLFFTTLIGGNISFPKSGIKCPPRIIRTCCSFGYDVGVMGIPFYKFDEITSIDQLGNHCYLSNKHEGNGIIYSQRGGFIDVGHLRDQADWSAFLYHFILNSKGAEKEIKLGYEAGVKKLTINVPLDFDDDDALLLAGQITYYLSLWHEISTWYGASSVPFVPERYSAFSIEDDYSNRLGVILGARAIKCDLPYDEAMTNNILLMLDTLGAVTTVQETIDAMEEVHGIWWTRKYRYPSKKILIERVVPNFDYATPMLVPTLPEPLEPYSISIPSVTLSNEPLSNFFDLKMKLNRKIPVRKIFPNKRRRIITEKDFETLLKNVSNDLLKKPKRTKK